MSLKEEVCSVGYAKRLKELGVKQDSPFQWVEVPVKYSIDTNLVKTITESEIKLVFGAFASIPEKLQEWAAFTIGQLFEFLPPYIDTKKDEPFNYFNFNLLKRNAKNIQYILNYYCDTRKLDQEGDPFFAPMLFQHNFYDEKLADALAKLLIELLERGYIKNG